MTKLSDRWHSLLWLSWQNWVPVNRVLWLPQNVSKVFYNIWVQFHSQLTWLDLTDCQTKMFGRFNGQLFFTWILCLHFQSFWRKTKSWGWVGGYSLGVHFCITMGRDHIQAPCCMTGSCLWLVSAASCKLQGPVTNVLHVGFVAAAPEQAGRGDTHGTRRPAACCPHSAESAQHPGEDHAQASTHPHQAGGR